jgi:hypothetical protein
VGGAIRQYCTVKALVDLGKIKTFRQLVKLLPYTSVAKDLKINPSRMKRLFFQDVGKMTLRELYSLSKLLQIDLDTLQSMVFKQLEKFK